MPRAMDAKPQSRLFRPAAALAAAVAAAVACAAPAARAALTSADMSGERYKPILERLPFGPGPKTGPTQEELDAQRKAAEEAAAAAVQESYIIPPGLDKIKITMLSRYRGTPAVGFLDGESGASYLLHEGEEFDGLSCLAINLEGQTATLSKAGFQAELPLWINPATTNCADVTTFGQPGGKAVDLASLPQTTRWEQDQAKAALEKERQDRAERRRLAREEREAARKAHEEEMAKLTPEEREQRMHDIAVDIIINDSGPPLPIDLNESDLRRLEDAGFDVSGVEAAGEGRGRGHRRGPGGGPRGFRGPPPEDE